LPAEALAYAGAGIINNAMSFKAHGVSVNPFKKYDLNKRSVAGKIKYSSLKAP
jgi:hypothetical protein